MKLQSPGAGKTKTARLWAYVRDERAWASQSPPAAFYRFSRDRKGERPAAHLADHSGWMHADGYSGFNEFYRSGRGREIACVAHIRRKLVDVFKSQGSVIAEKAIKRIAALYGIEKEMRSQSPEYRAAIRQEKAKPLLDDLENCLSDHGILEIDNNSAERSMRCVASRVPLCTSFLTIWKHWKLVLGFGATRGPFALLRGLNRFALQV